MEFRRNLEGCAILDRMKIGYFSLADKKCMDFLHGKKANTYRQE
jgi:hypothetical protein